MFKKFMVFALLFALVFSAFPSLQADAASTGVTKVDKGWIRDAYYLNDADTKKLIKSFESGSAKKFTDVVAEVIGKGVRGGGSIAEGIVQLAVKSKVKEIKKANKGKGVIIYYNRLYKSRSISVYSQ